MSTRAHWAEIGGFIDALAPRSPGRPVLVGVNGPQGAGKSSLCAFLAARSAAAGMPAVSVSLDDFYLTRAEQLALAAAHPGHRLLEHRGGPGTHDVRLAEATLRALTATPFQGPVAVPRYDKSAFSGRGDRAPSEAFTRVLAPPALVLVEGFTLGFRPLGAAAAAAREPGLAIVDAALRPYARLMAPLDAFVHLDAPGERLGQVVEWRVDAERARRAAGAPGLTDAEARDYIDRFLPLYAAYAPRLADAALGGADVAGPSLYGVLGPDRALVAPLEHRPAPGPRVPDAPRLVFRAWDGSDAADVALAEGLWGDPAVMRFLDARGRLCASGVAARLGREDASLRADGVQYWPFFERAGGEFCGVCGLHRFVVEDGPFATGADCVYELGFHLAPRAWGRGLATEAARAAADFAFERLGADALFAGHHPQNAASGRVLTKLGFARAGEVYFPPTGLMHPGYTLR